MSRGPVTVKRISPLIMASSIIMRPGDAGGYYWGAGFYGAAWPWFYPWYYGYAVPVFPYSVYSETAAPVEFVEMNPAPAADDAANVWYYCQNPQGYYPYVKSCAGGWQKVPVQPPK